MREEKPIEGAPIKDQSGKGKDMDTRYKIIRRAAQ